MKKLKLPHRVWVVESHPAITGGEWKRSLGPYFTENGAKSMAKNFRMFAPRFLVAARIRNTETGKVYEV